MASSSATDVSIQSAVSSADMQLVAACFRAYTEWLNLDLTFQDYATELSTLPGKYAHPRGALLLARDLTSGQVLGCIAMRPIKLEPEFKANRQPDTQFCELKRLYVYPAARRRNVARALVAEALRRAQEKGYDEALLDTVDSMTAAVSLYKSLGFIEVERYYSNPDSGFINMSKRLKP